ncbi:MAG: GcvT family protein [Pikeienuella sp.]
MAKTIIIGGGAVGLSLAYHLSKRNEQVVLVERGTLTSGTSWHAAGIVGPLRATPNMTRIASRALSTFPELEAETGLSTGYRKTGGYWLAREPDRMKELKRIAALGKHLGLTPSIVEPSEITCYGLNTAPLCGALAVTEDGNVNPVDLCMAYAKAAKNNGADIREYARVSEIMVQNGTAYGVRLSDGEILHAETVAVCAGAWSVPMAKRAGLSLPLQAVEHMYIVTEPVPNTTNPFPVLRDLDRNTYIKGDAGRLVIGGFEPNAKIWNAFGPEGDRQFLELAEDWDQFAPFMEAALELFPALETIGIQRFMNGPESFTSDSRPLVGAAPNVDGLYVATGMNSVGVMSSAGIGAALADWITDQTPPFDMWEIDIARTDPCAADPEHMKRRMKEAVSDVFDMHWPFKQPKAGRGLRRSALHEEWSKAGAVFGLTAGWERGLWFAKTEAEKSFPYSFGQQPWAHIAAREAQTMAAGASLLDLSPFTKIDISGPTALSDLQYLSCRSVDIAVGTTIYTGMLNDNGGFEIDLTITRTASDNFRLITGAATRWRDFAYLRRNLSQHSEINDVTEDEVVIGVMGDRSRSLLASLSNDDWNKFAFSTTRSVEIAGAHATATRISFVGELGWEIAAKTADGSAIFNALRHAGAEVMGHYALDGCRVEKGFLHWGHDLGPEVTPLEAGLGFMIDWSKPDFRGKTALECQRVEGVKKRLVQMQVSGSPLILHDEPIVEHGKVVGLTTSGALGPRTGLTLAFGMVDVAKGESKAETLQRRFQLDVAGTLYPAKPIKHPPYDPQNRRMHA